MVTGALCRSAATSGGTADPDLDRPAGLPHSNDHRCSAGGHWSGGMDRALSANVLAKSGKAVELAGDIDTLLLDKTGTITIGDRHASEYYPLPGVTRGQLAEAAMCASFGDQTPEGKSIVKLGEETLGSAAPCETADARVIPFTAQSRLSGLDFADGRFFRKGAPDAVQAYIRKQDAPYLRHCRGSWTALPARQHAHRCRRRQEGARARRANGCTQTGHPGSI